MDKSFVHMNDQGRPKMVDVSDKQESSRTAVAQTALQMSEETLSALKRGHVKKGDVLSVAQVAAVMAAKKTSEWIPMCHPIPITGVDVSFTDNEKDTLLIEAEVKTKSLTGVEMEAMTAVSAAALTVYDMCKSLDKAITIGPTRLLRKSGGKSGGFHRE